MQGLNLARVKLCETVAIIIYALKNKGCSGYSGKEMTFNNNILDYYLEYAKFIYTPCLKKKHGTASSTTVSTRIVRLQ